MSSFSPDHAGWLCHTPVAHQEKDIVHCPGRGGGEAGVKARSLSCASACSGVQWEVVKQSWWGGTTVQSYWDQAKFQAGNLSYFSLFYLNFFLVAVISFRKVFPICCYFSFFFFLLLSHYTTPQSFVSCFLEFRVCLSRTFLFSSYI